MITPIWNTGSRTRWARTKSGRGCCDGSSSASSSSRRRCSLCVDRELSKALEIETVHFPEQLDECPRAEFDRCLAFGGGCRRCVADRAGRIEIVAHPTERRRSVRREPFKLFFHRQCGRGKRCNARGPHPCATPVP